MKDFRFYLEFPDKAAKKKSGRGNVGHCGTVVAVMPETLDMRRLPGCFDAVAAIAGGFPNAQCGSTIASVAYLREECKRIPERLAREIHPALFVYLEYEP